MANKNRFTKSTVKRAIEGSRGNLTKVAETLMVTRQTVYNYVEKYPDLRDLLDVERESLVDVAESKLVEMLNAGEHGAVFFVLETQGKKRGWTRRQELTGADGADLNFSFGGIIEDSPPAAAAEDKASSANPEPAR